MAIYDKIPEERPTRKTKRTGTISRIRSQMPGHPTDEPRGLSEPATKSRTKETKPIGRSESNKLDGKDKPLSNRLDNKNKGAKVGGKGTTRDTVAQGARKASTPSPKPKGTDKKVRG